jgi:hypothetical protein
MSKKKKRRKVIVCNKRHADWTHTSFELINGEAPVAILITFKNIKFSSVAEKIKNLVTSREEALAAHELAWNCMAERIKSNFVPFKKGQMVWLDSRHLKTNYHKKDKLSQEDGSKTRRTIWNQGGTGTGYLPIETPGILANPQSLPCHTAPSLLRK